MKFIKTNFGNGLHIYNANSYSGFEDASKGMALYYAGDTTSDTLDAYSEKVEAVESAMKCVGMAGELEFYIIDKGIAVSYSDVQKAFYDTDRSWREHVSFDVVTKVELS